MTEEIMEVPHFIQQKKDKLFLKKYEEKPKWGNCWKF